MKLSPLVVVAKWLQDNRFSVNLDTTSPHVEQEGQYCPGCHHALPVV